MNIDTDSDRPPLEGIPPELADVVIAHTPHRLCGPDATLVLYRDKRKRQRSYVGRSLNDALENIASILDIDLDTTR
jgi:hypothetical protein